MSLIPYTAHAVEGFPPYLLEWGSEGTGNGQFDRPWAIALGPDGNVYVTQVSQQSVQVFTPNGVFIRKWGNFSTLGNRVNGIAINQDGVVFVTADAKVVKLTNTGGVLNSWSLGIGSTAQGITIDHDGFLYVTDSSFHRIAKYTQDGALVTRWGRMGSAPGQFNGPIGITVDGQNNIYVCDVNNRRIQMFRSDSTYVRSISGTAADSTGTPGYHLAADPYGHLYASVGGIYHQVQVWDTTGGFWYRWGHHGTGPAQFDEPFGIALAPTGEVYVADGYNHRVQKFGGSVVGVPAAAPPSPIRIRVLGSPLIRGQNVGVSIKGGPGEQVKGMVCRVDGSVATKFDIRMNPQGSASLSLSGDVSAGRPGVYFLHVWSNGSRATTRYVVAG